MLRCDFLSQIYLKCFGKQKKNTGNCVFFKHCSVKGVLAKNLKIYGEKCRKTGKKMVGSTGIEPIRAFQKTPHFSHFSQICLKKISNIFSPAF